MLRVVILAVSIVCATLVQANAGIQVPSGPGKRLALVIGNDDYKELPKLQRAANDARAVGSAMQQIGFDVTTGLNLGKAETLASVDKLGEAISSGDTVFVFFAGQAFLSSGRDYVLPTDTPKLSNMSALIAASVSLEDIIAPLKARNPARIILVVDGCRDNPFKDGLSRDPSSGLSAPAADNWDGVFVLYSAGIGQVAMEGLSTTDTDPNSLFTRFFIKAVGKPGQTLSELAVDLRRNVTPLASGAGVRQTPAYYDQLPDAFALVPAR